MNQNLLIVDDEVEILDWLDEMFRYEFDMEVDVYKANSALEALNLLSQVKFDVVLTDIRMPGMDGITLFRKIKENWPRCKTVFLTGYGSFDEMYQIFKHQDVRYVLKSEEDEVIQEAVRQSLKEVIGELEQEEQRQKQKQKLERAAYWLRKESIDRIIAGELSEEEIEGTIREAGILWNPVKPFLTALLRLDFSAKEQTPYLLMQSLAQVVEDNMPQRLINCTHLLDNNQLLLFVQSKEEAESGEGLAVITQGAVEYTQEIFRNSYSETFSAIIKNKLIAADQLSNTVSRLKQLMVGYLGKDREVIYQEEMMAEREPDENVSEIIRKIPMLKTYLELRKRKEFFDLLSLCTGKMEDKSRHDTYALETYYSISVLLLQFINENHLNEQLAFRVALYKLTREDEHKNWAEAWQYLFEVSDAVFDQLGDNDNTLADRALSRVITYINDHIGEDLPLTTLANVGGFNASYLSRLFKQEHKTTVTDYILDKRMKLAEELLACGDEKVQEVAAKAGYPSPNSFARAFRGYTGVSPAEYREVHKK